MGQRGRKSWTNPDEEEFLISRLPEYIKCQPTKAYGNFWADTFRVFLEKWPERARLSGKCAKDQTCVLAEGDLPEVQLAALKISVQKRKAVSHFNRPEIRD